MYLRKPEWLKIKVEGGEISGEVKRVLRKLSLHTVCEEANCPNRMECFNRKTATFMVLGNNCTRNCTFCNVTKGTPTQVDPEEPVKVAEAAKLLGIKHLVVTSVTRDDLADGGAGHFASIIAEARKQNPSMTIEVLIPDFNGSSEALDQVIDAKPDIINHNIETVPALYRTVRPMAIYERSLELLKWVKSRDPAIITKSGIMLGLGEKYEEVLIVLADLRKVECDYLTIGQYLAPSKEHHPIVEYIHPEIFDKYRNIALTMGFKQVMSGPLVRSSYHASV
jgi:lipoic acid synthetase